MLDPTMGQYVTMERNEVKIHVTTWQTSKLLNTRCTWNHILCKFMHVESLEHQSLEVDGRLVEGDTKVWTGASPYCSWEKGFLSSD